MGLGADFKMRQGFSAGYEALWQAGLAAERPQQAPHTDHRAYIRYRKEF